MLKIVCLAVSLALAVPGLALAQSAKFSAVVSATAGKHKSQQITATTWKKHLRPRNARKHTTEGNIVMDQMPKPPDTFLAFQQSVLACAS